MPPAPKEPSLLARRNKTTTRSTLTKPTRPKIPPLPADVKWSSRVREWWKRSWSSAMSKEWDDTDLDNMLMLALLHQHLWHRDTTPGEARALASEIRQLKTVLGLTPMSRRSLQWELPTPNEPATAGAKKAPAKKVAARPDPRAARANLHAV
jgi:hypothetical protein